MVKYECFRCGYSTKHRGNFQHHLNRKNICNPIEDNVSIDEIKKYYNIYIYDITTGTEQVKPAFKQVSTDNIYIKTTGLEQVKPAFLKKTTGLEQVKPAFSKNIEKKCDYCNKMFTRTYGLNCHLKICKIKKQVEKNIILENTAIIEMSKEIEELKKLKVQTLNNIINTNSNNITNNIIINNYGDENIKHIKSKDYACLLNGIYSAVPKLIKQIHFDPKHPKNHNIKLPNKKYPYLKVMKDNKWELINKKPELLDLIDSKYFILKERYYNILEKNKYTLSDSQKLRIDNFIDKYQEEDKDVILDLLNKTELVLLNNI